MNRRTLLACLFGLAGVGIPLPEAAFAQSSADTSRIKTVWAAWRDANLDATGRVVDRLQQNSSHSEGQGYGMLLAVSAGDSRAFAEMENWARVNLAIRADNLMAWRWLPDRPERVPDINNASDGDLFRAWALFKAARRFNVPEYRDRAAAIVADLAARCLARDPRSGTLLMLPAAQGFRTENGFVYNPSYAMPLAMRELGAEFGAPDLVAAADGALEVDAALAEDGVVPDWIEVTETGLRTAEGFSGDAGYEAIRVPLFLIWSGYSTHPAVARYAEVQARAPSGMAATIIGRSQGQIVKTSDSPGYTAVSALSVCVTGTQVGSQIPPFVPSESYYPATLHLFAMLAQMQGAPGCLPI